MGPHLLNAPTALSVTSALIYGKEDLWYICLLQETACMLWAKDHVAVCSRPDSQSPAQYLVRGVLNEFLVNMGEVFIHDFPSKTKAS